jgi:ParB family chromosome partitioning protein
MRDDTPEIVKVPVWSIRVLNPRARNQKIFRELVTSIAHLGLKKPITVRRHQGDDQYDLVCGQGRLEAFIELGQEAIPAMVVEAEEEDCFIMSLVENLARRHHTPLELVRQIGALKERGYSIAEIAAKTDVSADYAYAICYLLAHGEERLINGVERGVIPPSVAIEIAKAEEGDVQAALAEAYENHSLPGNQIIAIRRIVDLRRTHGKSPRARASEYRPRGPTTADQLVRAYRRETDRQKALVKKATLAQSRLLFIINGLRRLMADPHFVTLLRAEGIPTMPTMLVDKLRKAEG